MTAATVAVTVPYWLMGSDVTTTCPRCGRHVRRRLDDRMYTHRTRPKLGVPCPGSGQRPIVTVGVSG